MKRTFCTKTKFFKPNKNHVKTSAFKVVLDESIYACVRRCTQFNQHSRTTNHQSVRRWRRVLTLIIYFRGRGHNEDVCLDKNLTVTLHWRSANDTWALFLWIHRNITNKKVYRVAKTKNKNISIRSMTFSMDKCL